LLPSLGRAREQARATMCASNMGAIGKLINIFAQQRDGRAPGGGELANPSLINDRFADWADILNYDIMDVNTTDYNMGAQGGGLFNHPATLYGIRELQAVGDYDGFIKSKRFLVCPDFEPLSNWERMYAINLDAAGGNAYTIPGPYGVAIDPATACSSPTFYWRPTPPWTVGNCGYALGAKLSRFSNTQFLLVENQYEEFYPQSGNHDVVSSANKYGSVLLNSNYPFCALKNQLAFRHPLGKRANFLFFDFHVEPLTPKDNVYSKMRLWIDYNGG
jgi:prepilin-type processing-associated H-X9-DG protein